MHLRLNLISLIVSLTKMQFTTNYYTRLCCHTCHAFYAKQTSPCAHLSLLEIEIRIVHCSADCGALSEAEDKELLGHLKRHHLTWPSIVSAECSSLSAFAWSS